MRNVLLKKKSKSVYENSQELMDAICALLKEHGADYRIIKKKEGKHWFADVDDGVISRVDYFCVGLGYSELTKSTKVFISVHE
jgi:hypothetical protein